MAELSLQDMQRELHNFALAEMRNRGIDAALRVIDNRLKRSDSYVRSELVTTRGMIAALKTDPSSHLSNWFSQPQAEPDCFYDDGAP